MNIILLASMIIIVLTVLVATSMVMVNKDKERHLSILKSELAKTKDPAMRAMIKSQIYYSVTGRSATSEAAFRIF